MPDHHIRRLGEQGKEGSESLPVIQLFRRQGMAKSQIPIISRHLRDGDIRFRTIQKKNRKANSQRSITTPPITAKTNRGTVTDIELNMIQEQGSDFNKFFPELGSMPGHYKQRLECGKYLVLRIEYHKEPAPLNSIRKK